MRGKPRVLVTQIVENLRTALDYMIFELSVLNERELNERLPQFVVADSESDFERQAKRRLADIDAGLVEQIVVYKVDRLTRSREVKILMRFPMGRNVVTRQAVHGSVVIRKKRRSRIVGQTAMGVEVLRTRVVSENANGAESSNPGGVLEIHGDQPTRHWICDRRPRPVPKLGPLEIDRKSEPFDVYNDVGSPHPFAAKRPILAALNCGINDDRVLRSTALESAHEMAARRTKPSFGGAFRSRRCLVPADGWFEWQRDRVGQVAYFVALEDGSPISFAALWEHWGKSKQCPRILQQSLRRQPHLVFRFPVPSINSSCVRLASCLRPGCLGRLHVGRFEDRRRLYSGV